MEYIKLLTSLTKRHTQLDSALRERLLPSREFSAWRLLVKPLRHLASFLILLASNPAFSPKTRATGAPVPDISRLQTGNIRAV